MPRPPSPATLAPAEPAHPLPLIPTAQRTARPGWTGPLVLVILRSAMLLICQALMVLVLAAAHRPHTWRDAGGWWNVYGTVVDLACLLALRHFARQEGLGLRDLLGPIRMRRAADLLLGLGYFLIIFPFFLGGSYVARLLLYKSSEPNPMVMLTHLHPLPLWAAVYSLSLWWLIWSPTEELTYQAYALPRLQALTGRTWLAFVIVGFFWAAQHCALPLVLDWRFALYRFLSFLPGVLALMFFFWRKRRLAPLIVAHWPMDIAATIASALY